MVGAQGKASSKEKVLIVCTGNSCRSQMAEALWRTEGGEAWEVASAGTMPAGVHPLARRVIEELGIDMSEQFSKSVYELDPGGFHLVVTVCDAASDACPHFGTHPRHEHWPFPDPIHATGEEEARLVEFRRVRDLIHEQIRLFLQGKREGEGAPEP